MCQISQFNGTIAILAKVSRRSSGDKCSARAGAVTATVETSKVASPPLAPPSPTRALTDEPSRYAQFKLFEKR